VSCRLLPGLSQHTREGGNLAEEIAGEERRAPGQKEVLVELCVACKYVCVLRVSMCVLRVSMCVCMTLCTLLDSCSSLREQEAHKEPLMYESRAHMHIQLRTISCSARKHEHEAYTSVHTHIYTPEPQTRHAAGHGPQLLRPRIC